MLNCRVECYRIIKITFQSPRSTLASRREGILRCQSFIATQFQDSGAFSSFVRFYWLLIVNNITATTIWQRRDLLRIRAVGFGFTRLHRRNLSTYAHAAANEHLRIGYLEERKNFIEKSIVWRRNHNVSGELSVRCVIDGRFDIITSKFARNVRSWKSATWDNVKLLQDVWSVNRNRTRSQQ